MTSLEKSIMQQVLKDLLLELSKPSRQLFSRMYGGSIDVDPIKLIVRLNDDSLKNALRQASESFNKLPPKKRINPVLFASV